MAGFPGRRAGLTAFLVVQMFPATLLIMPLYVLLVPIAALPIAVAHGEGYADFTQRGDATRVHAALRFVDNAGGPTERYPANPNGSPGGLTGVTTQDGRFTALMPHPERVFRNVQMSWTSGERSAPSPWLRMFESARKRLRE